MIHYLTRSRSHLPFSPIALHTPFTPSPHCTNTSTTLLPDLLRGVFYSYSIHRCVGLTGASSLHRHPHTAFHSTPTPIQFPLTFPQPPHPFTPLPTSPQSFPNGFPNHRTPSARSTICAASCFPLCRHRGERSQPAHQPRTRSEFD